MADIPACPHPVPTYRMQFFHRRAFLFSSLLALGLTAGCGKKKFRAGTFGVRIQATGRGDQHRPARLG
jgi:hypothetical protein